MITIELYLTVFAALLSVTCCATYLIVGWKLNKKKASTKQPLKFASLTKKNNMKTLDQLIHESKGKFFSVTFIKKDGSIRTINGKDKYRRLIAGTKESPNPNPVKNAGFVSFVNRNKENWASAHKNGVLVFKCGEIKAEFVQA
jgi:hypothetical protein